LTRNWVWRQCEKDKVTERTKNVFIPIDVLGEVGRERANEILQELSLLLPKFLGGTLLTALLDRETSFSEFHP
jgi:DNA/RNA-binding domain of Phe-tRNA-synthetase-like protein